ncbi:MAG: hypothetical protein FWH54_00625 [Methanobrevibacter sp.]|nr:hypothetical protein [Methanobrevibacter sp.]
MLKIVAYDGSHFEILKKLINQLNKVVKLFSDCEALFTLLIGVKITHEL